VNLFEVLPLFRLNAGDGGFFIDKASIITRDPGDPVAFEKQNVAAAAHDWARPKWRRGRGSAGSSESDDVDMADRAH
jgi:hypothetical protein